MSATFTLDTIVETATEFFKFTVRFNTYFFRAFDHAFDADGNLLEYAPKRCAYAAETGSVPLMKFLIAVGFAPSETTFAVAFSQNGKHILDFLKSINCRMPSYAENSA